MLENVKPGDKLWVTSSAGVGGVALGFLLGVALVLLVGAFIAGDLNKDRGGDAVE